MPALEHGFFFDPNFALGSESVFTLADRVEIPPLPPIEGFFLLLMALIFYSWMEKI